METLFKQTLRRLVSCITLLIPHDSSKTRHVLHELVLRTRSALAQICVRSQAKSILGGHREYSKRAILPRSLYVCFRACLVGAWLLLFVCVRSVAMDSLTTPIVILILTTLTLAGYPRKAPVDRRLTGTLHLTTIRRRSGHHIMTTLKLARYHRRIPSDQHLTTPRKLQAIPDGVFLPEVT